MCWRQLHNVLERKCIKSGGKSRFSLSFLFHTVNDIRRKLYVVEIHLTVGKRAKRMPDPTVELAFSNLYSNICRMKTGPKCSVRRTARKPALPSKGPCSHDANTKSIWIPSWARVSSSPRTHRRLMLEGKNPFKVGI